MVDLAALRESLRKLAPGAVPLGDPRRTGLSTGVADLDRQLSAGGFPRGAVSELHGGPSSGKTALALSAIAAHTGLAVFVDGGRQLFPPSAAALGVALERLLVVRPPCALDGDELAAAAAQAAEIVARSGAFGLIVIDLPPGVRLLRSPAARMRGAMQRAAATALVIGGGGSGPVFDGALARLAVRSCGGQTMITVEKGGAGTVELRHGRLRLDDRPGSAVAELSRRLPPGIERAP